MISTKKRISGLADQWEEREGFSSKDRPAMSNWAEANYVLSAETSDIPGPWSNDYTPFLAPIMDWWSDMTTRQITIVKCTQAGGSELANIAVGYTCDVEPAPTLIVMPREEDAKRRLATRIRPMFKANPRLMRHLPRGRLDNLNIGYAMPLRAFRGSGRILLMRLAELTCEVGQCSLTFIVRQRHKQAHIFESKGSGCLCVAETGQT